jgi:hypothetical protein
MCFLIDEMGDPNVASPLRSTFPYKMERGGSNVSKTSILTMLSGDCYGCSNKIH